MLRVNGQAKSRVRIGVNDSGNDAPESYLPINRRQRRALEKHNKKLAKLSDDKSK